jgi:DNA segregation ATPase FtsK/SpoIIIE-like protein
MNNRDNFLWRPNDNSATTNIRYSLEAEKWTKAFQSASTKSTVSLGEALGTVGLILSIITLSILFVLICISDLVKWILEKREEAAEIKRVRLFNENQKIQILEKKKEILKAKLIKLELPVLNRSDRDPLFKKAALHVVNKQKVSIPLLQFDFNIEFDQACKIIDDLVNAGIITKFNSNNQRKVLISNIETLNLLFEIEEEREKNKN